MVREEDVYAACKDAHAIAILTEWDMFKTLVRNPMILHLLLSIFFSCYNFVCRPEKFPIVVCRTTRAFTRAWRSPPSFSTGGTSSTSRRSRRSASKPMASVGAVWRSELLGEWHDIPRRSLVVTYYTIQPTKIRSFFFNIPEFFIPSSTILPLACTLSRRQGSFAYTPIATRNHRPVERDLRNLLSRRGHSAVSEAFNLREKNSEGGGK